MKEEVSNVFRDEGRGQEWIQRRKKRLVMESEMKEEVSNEVRDEGRGQ